MFSLTCVTAASICNHMSCLDIVDNLGDNCIQNFHLGRYIVGYTIGNLVLCVAVKINLRIAVKLNFQQYIRRYTSSNENFEYSYPNSNALLTFYIQKDSKNVLCCAYTYSGCQLHIFTCQPMKSDVM